MSNTTSFIIGAIIGYWLHKQKQCDAATNDIVLADMARISLDGAITKDDARNYQATIFSNQPIKGSYVKNSKDGHSLSLNLFATGKAIDDDITNFNAINGFRKRVGTIPMSF